jgi:hypothetical protein
MTSRGRAAGGLQLLSGVRGAGVWRGLIDVNHERRLAALLVALLLDSPQGERRRGGDPSGEEIVPPYLRHDPSFPSRSVPKRIVWNPPKTGL